MSNSGNEELVYDTDELIKISETLKQTMEELSEASTYNFSKLNGIRFYSSGQAEEEMDRILTKNGRNDVDFPNQELLFVGGVAEDYYGKLQMLMQYYSILSEYCFTGMLEVKENDEKIAQYIQQVQGG